MRSHDIKPSPTPDLMQHVYAASVLRGRWFRSPSDTWTMALFHRSSSGDDHVTGLPAPTLEAKAEVALVIEFALKAARSVEALLVAPAWEALVTPDIAARADVSGGAATGFRRGELVPARDGVEVLLFLHVGPAFAVTRSAPVLRRPDVMPTLGSLSPIRGEGIEVDGLFTDAMRRGIG